MRPLRVALAVVLLALGVFAILLATDLRNWRNALDSGDTAYAQLPSSAQWSATTRLPFSLAE